MPSSMSQTRSNTHSVREERRIAMFSSTTTLGLCWRTYSSIWCSSRSDRSRSARTAVRFSPEYLLHGNPNRKRSHENGQHARHASGSSGAA
eukprot:7384706-Prymnesium_polylepis.1